MKTWLHAITIAALAFSSAASAEWLYSETADAMSDVKYARTFVDGTGGKLGVKCDAPGADSLYIHFISSEYLGGAGARSAARKLMIRIDEDAPQEMTWSYDGRSAILTRREDVWSLISRIRVAKRVAVRSWDYEYRQHDATFDTAGAGPSIERVIATCGATAA